MHGQIWCEAGDGFTEKIFVVTFFINWSYTSNSVYFSFYYLSWLLAPVTIIPLSGPEVKLLRLLDRQSLLPLVQLDDQQNHAASSHQALWSSLLLLHSQLNHIPKIKRKRSPPQQPAETCTAIKMFTYSSSLPLR